MSVKLEPHVTEKFAIFTFIILHLNLFLLTSFSLLHFVSFLPLFLYLSLSFALSFALSLSLSLSLSHTHTLSHRLSNSLSLSLSPSSKSAHLSLFQLEFYYMILLPLN